MPLVLFLLVADVVADGCFVSPYGRYEVAPCPEVLPNEVALVVEEPSGDVDRALSLDVPHHLGDRVLRWNRDQHVHVIRHEVTFKHLALLLPRQRSKHLSEPPPNLTVERLLPVLRNEDDVVFTLPDAVA